MRGMDGGAMAFCGQLCPCGKVAATLEGNHAVARRRAKQQPFTTFLLPPAAATSAAASTSAREQRLSRIHDHVLSHRRALLAAWHVERPLSQPAAASAHDCTVLMQTLIGLPSVNPDQVRNPLALAEEGTIVSARCIAHCVPAPPDVPRGARPVLPRRIRDCWRGPSRGLAGRADRGHGW